MGDSHDAAPAISILVSTKDRRAELDRALASLRQLDYPRQKLEIVVVEETDDPRPPEGVRYVTIPLEHRGYGHTRRVAVSQARHDLLLFTDDDCVVEPTWAAELVRAFEPDVAGVAGAVLVEPTNTLGYCENILGFPGGGLKYVVRANGRAHDTRALSTCNCAYRRAALEEAGGFAMDTTYGGEDQLLASRVAARHRCRYTPAAVVYHKPRGSWRGLARWFIRRGNSQAELAKYTDAPPRHFAGMAASSMTLRLALLLLLLLVTGVTSLPVLALLAAIYYAAMLSRYFYGYRYYRSLGRARSLAVWLTVPLVKLVLDFSLDVGRLQGLAARRWRR
ncbi:MAG: glycosyltransferase [Candidatus Tectomicrobia bacterium]|nr:glycosyltransferase [Candidatus Tectomicrobia bacterium]